MPRLFHVADTHLGYQAYNRLTPEGYNQREVDAQEAFRRVVDAAVADPPDAFIHAGDLFDHPRPSNRAIAFALHEVRRLSDAKIPTVLVTGNHDAPRMRETGSIFRIFDGLPHVRAVYRGEREEVQLDGLTVHAVPQAVTQEAFRRELQSARPQGPAPHVLVVHGTVLGVDGLFTSEFNEYQIHLGDIHPGYAYVALGHFHNRKAITPRIHYAGSTESFSFAEAGQEKGFLEVEVGPDTPQVTHRATAARPMIDIGHVDAETMDADAVRRAVREALRRPPPSAIARVTVDALDRALARTIDWDELRAERRDLLHLELRLNVREEAGAPDGALELHPLSQEFDAFLARHPLPNVDRDRVRAEALRLLSADRGGPHAG